MRVLIVDSSIEIVDRLEEILSESAVVTAIYKTASSKEALAILKNSAPDVVLLDIFLPENESVNLLKSIKKANGKTLVIILSVQTDNFMQKHYTLLGADYVFDKYHDFEKIPGVISLIAQNNNLY
ncbi:MAG: response regulator [Ferruginibacter sp.]